MSLLTTAICCESNLLSALSSLISKCALESMYLRRVKLKVCGSRTPHQAVSNLFKTLNLTSEAHLRKQTSSKVNPLDKTLFARTPEAIVLMKATPTLTLCMPSLAIHRRSSAARPQFRDRPSPQPSTKKRWKFNRLKSLCSS
jgi:hypothetical protein